MNEQNLVTIPAKPGQVLNPNGRGKGTKNIMTVVREFIDKPVGEHKGMKISRFQFLLLSMYDIARQLQKQADRYLEEYETMRKLLITDDSINHPESDNDYWKAFRRMEAKRKRYEEMIEKVQNSHIKLSEFFIKSTGQLVEKKKIEQSGNITTVVSVNPEDLKNAVEDLKNEF